VDKQTNNRLHKTTSHFHDPEAIHLIKNAVMAVLPADVNPLLITTPIFGAQKLKTADA
jgi:hypothetical protein